MQRHSKIKGLAPTLRETQRYIVYRAFTENPKGIEKDLMKHIEACIGTFGKAEANIHSVSYNPGNATGILRARADYVDAVKASMLLFPGATIKSEGVSGTINKAKIKFM